LLNPNKDRSVTSVGEQARSHNVEPAFDNPSHEFNQAPDFGGAGGLTHESNMVEKSIYDRIRQSVNGAMRKTSQQN
jgi:hypothetical protein